MKKLRWMLPLFAGFLVLSTGCPTDDPDADVSDYRVELVGENQNPPVATPANGEMTVTLDENRILTIDGSFDNLVSQLRSVEGSPIHIHVGGMDENGPIVFRVDVDANDDQRSGTFSMTQQLAADQVRLFENNEYYLNIHSNAYPDGELRGQLDSNAPEFAGLDESWGVELNTADHPHNVSTDAEGWVWAILRDDDTFVISGALQNLTSDIVEVNLERGEPGETGAMIFDLTTDERDENGHRFFGETTLTGAQMDDLRDGLYYINVITIDYPDGELRGQLDDESSFFRNIWEDIFGDSPEEIDEAPPF